MYFPFADGALGYSCIECGFRCCKGAGFGGTRSEIVQLTARYPALAMFVNPQRDPEAPYVALTNFSPSCFFLREDGACRVQVDHGRALKPHVCRTFPVNHLGRVGAWFIADLNFLCPMRPLQPGDSPITYTDVLADLEISREVPLAMSAEPEDRLPPALIALEMWLRDRPHSQDVLARFAEADLVSARWERTITSPSAVLASAHRSYLDGLRMLVGRFLGTTPRLAGGRELALLAPRLRLALLQQRRTPVVADVLGRMGRHLVALSVWLDVIAQLGTPITLGVVEQAFRNSIVFCELLGQLDRVPQVGDDQTYQLTMYRTREPELLRVLQFIRDENPQRRLTLAQVFEELALVEPGVRAQILQSFTPEALGHLLFDP